MRKFGKSDEAFTGLEAAIVLIAFVVVAAVFSYVMLGAGFFTSQKSQEVVHTSVQQASSSVENVGNVIGYGADILNSADGDKKIGRKISEVQFNIATTAGGSAFDLQNLVVVYTDKNTHLVIDCLDGLIDDFGVKAYGTGAGYVEPQEADEQAGYWAVTEYLKSQDGTMGDDGGDPAINYVGDVLVEPGEQVVITVHLPQGANDQDAAAILLMPKQPFTIELKPTAGPSLLIKRNAPSQIDDVNILY
jgi:flagellin FlaB